MSKRRPPRVPLSRDPRQLRQALRGMDGGQQLRAALDEVHGRVPGHDVVFVNNGGRGPAVIDTRARPPGGWVLEGLIPTGVVAALADLDDPSPQTLLENGFDVVVLLEMRGPAVVGEPVLQRVYFHPRLGLRGGHPGTVAPRDRLADLKIDKHESARVQKLAQVDVGRPRAPFSVRFTGTGWERA